MKKEKIYEGKSKIFYEGKEEFTMIEFFKDTVLLEDGSCVESSGKGVLRNTMSSFLMEKLDMVGIDNHFIEKINMREQLVQMVDILPLEVKISYISAGRYVSQLGLEEGYVFDKPLIDYTYKSKSKLKSIINEHHLSELLFIPEEDINAIKDITKRAGDFLSGFFAGIGLRLVDTSFKFGRVFNGEYFVTMIADEVSLDTCRVWDIESNEKMDFEAMAKEPVSAIQIYKDILKRMKVI